MSVSVIATVTTVTTVTNRNYTVIFSAYDPFQGRRQTPREVVQAVIRWSASDEVNTGFFADNDDFYLDRAFRDPDWVEVIWQEVKLRLEA